MKKLISIPFIITLLLWLTHYSLFAVQITYEGKVRLSDKTLLQAAASFCLTEDNLFMVIDYKAGDIKIYQADGKLLNIIGRKGFGPNELASPLFSCYHNQQFVVYDPGQKQLFFYKRKGKYDLTRSASFRISYGVDDLVLNGHMLYLSGNRAGGAIKKSQPDIYSFFSIDTLNNNRYNDILPDYLKYGLSSWKTSKLDIVAIGNQGLFDIDGDYAYYAWQCDLKIFKINLKTKDRIAFSNKTSLYIKPRSSAQLLDALNYRDYNKLIQLRKRMSYLRKIIATPRFVLVIYTTPDPDNEDSIFLMQAYNLAGEFISEQRVTGEISFPMIFDKNGNMLYSIGSDIGEDDSDEYYSIFKHKISD